MNKSRFQKFVVYGAAAAISAAPLFMCGVASASPDQSGKKFSDAQTALQRAGYVVIVSSAIGDRKARADCVVVQQQDLSGGFPSSWLTSQTVNGIFIGGDQPTLYAGPGYGNIPASGQVTLSLAC